MKFAMKQMTWPKWPSCLWFLSTKMFYKAFEKNLISKCNQSFGKKINFSWHIPILALFKFQPFWTFFPKKLCTFFVCPKWTYKPNLMKRIQNSVCYKLKSLAHNFLGNCTGIFICTYFSFKGGGPTDFCFEPLFSRLKPEKYIYLVLSPLFNSKKTQMWPILCNIVNLDDPFLVACYYGQGKPIPEIRRNGINLRKAHWLLMA